MPYKFFIARCRRLLFRVLNFHVPKWPGRERCRTRHIFSWYKRIPNFHSFIREIKICDESNIPCSKVLSSLPTCSSFENACPELNPRKIMSRRKIYPQPTFYPTSITKTSVFTVQTPFKSHPIQFMEWEKYTSEWPCLTMVSVVVTRKICALNSVVRRKIYYYAQYTLVQKK